MHRYKELTVWKDAMDIAFELYELTAKFPSEEKFALTSQLRRAGVSVPSNIAEGAGRNTNGEFNQFLGFANGSSFEVDTQLILAERLNYISQNEYNDVSEKLVKNQNMLYKLQKTLKK